MPKPDTQDGSDGEAPVPAATVIQAPMAYMKVAAVALPLRCSGPLRRMAAELQYIGTRQLRDHVPLGLEFDYVHQLAGQPAPGEKEAWNANTLMEGVRTGNGRSDFLAASEDRVKAE